MATSPDFEHLILQAGQIFTPSIPVGDKDTFAGREAEIIRAVDAINQRGRHAVIYGERGVGKTSLANILATKLRSTVPIIAPRVNCDSTDTFSRLWKKVFAEVDLLKKKRQAPGFQLTIYEETVAASEVVGDEITPGDIRRLLVLLGTDKMVILIFDEFDRLDDLGARRAMADTIKALADHDVEATIVLVGVADSVEELIAEHKSIERGIEQIKMPRMNRDEVIELLSKGLSRLQMTITAQAQRRIVLLCQGLPHYAHLLALQATRTALAERSMAVEERHVSRAIQRAFEASQQSLQSDLKKATTSPQKGKHLYSEVLLACALAKADQFGFFYAADVKEPLTRIMKKPYFEPSFVKHLKDFCEPSRGPVLQRVGVKHKFQYRFVNPLMQPLVIMKGVVDKRISEATLEEEWLEDKSQR